LWVRADVITPTDHRPLHVRWRSSKVVVDPVTRHVTSDHARWPQFTFTASDRSAIALLFIISVVLHRILLFAMIRACELQIYGWTKVNYELLW